MTDNGGSLLEDQAEKTSQLTVATGADRICALPVEDFNLLTNLQNAVAPRQPDQISHWRILRRLGSGGMGAVYLAEDQRDGQQVALKVMGASAFPDEIARRRFQKEARMLAEVRHPNVTSLIEAGEYGGQCCLAMEFINGVDLQQLLARRPQLSVPAALRIVRDVADALAAAHSRGIVHRDIKPGNILLSCSTAKDGPPAEAVLAALNSGFHPQVKLTDFGLARPVEQTESLNLTQTGAMLGTPYYFAPEQCTGTAEICPATDVYSLGVTLFEMLAGRRPFQIGDPVKLIAQHCFEQPPDLRKLNPDVGDGLAQVVSRAMEKRPENRFADAGQLAQAIDRLLRGDTTDLEPHPALPTTGGQVVEARWEWELSGSTEQLWPLVTSTDRLNAAIGLPAVEYSTGRDQHGALQKFGSFRLGWARLSWEEHPFEWIEGRRMGVLREFTNGPFHWFLMVVELKPRADGGTLLTHSVRIAPRGLLGRLLAAIEVGFKGRRTVDRVCRRMDDVVCGRITGGIVVDPFEPPARLGRAVKRRFELREKLLRQNGGDADCTSKLVQYLREAPLQEVARIRPLQLARQLGLPADRLTETCLRASQAGLLELHWDILCPTCRVSSSVRDTLSDIGQHSSCEACDLQFDVDFANAVELIFRVHGELRQADLKTYCAGGPDHAPHVVAQTRLSAGESLELDLLLDPGNYVLRGPQLPFSVPLKAGMEQGSPRASVLLSPGTPSRHRLEIRAGRQLLTLENAFDRPLLVRLERSVHRDDVLTAGAASRLPLFQELFPEEVVSPDQLASLSTSAFLGLRATDLDHLLETLSESAAFGEMRSRMQSVRKVLEAGGGQIVREQDDQLLAVFGTTDDALQTAVRLLQQGGTQPGRSQSAGKQACGLVLHRGTAMTASVNGRLDCYGQTVSSTARMLARVQPQRLLLSSELSRDADILEQLELHGLRAVASQSGRPAAAELTFALDSDDSKPGSRHEPGREWPIPAGGEA